jgi:adenosine/AMP kinase
MLTPIKEFASGQEAFARVSLGCEPSPLGVETDADIAWRKDLLRKIGYKL